MGYCFNRYALAGLVPNDCHKKTTHFVTQTAYTCAEVWTFLSINERLLDARHSCKLFGQVAFETR